MCSTILKLSLAIGAFCAASAASMATSITPDLSSHQPGAVRTVPYRGIVRSRLAYGGGYIIPGSDVNWLTVDDLYGLSSRQLRLARNEIYARHGCIFRDRFLQAYFNRQAWYYPVRGRWAANFNRLNRVERHNVALIQQLE